MGHTSLQEHFKSLLTRVDVPDFSFHSPRVREAALLAEQLYSNTVLEGSSIFLIHHVCGIASLLLEFCPDEDAIVACLLQHCLQYTDCTLHMIGERFGSNVHMLVSRVHLLSHINSHTSRSSFDTMKVMLVSVSDDVRVLLLKLVDQVYILEHISLIDEAVRMRLGRASLHLFAPVAARLGIYALKYRLEDSAFPLVHPVDSEHITAQLAQLHKEHGVFLPLVEDALRTFLLQEGMQCEVSAREKHPYSLFHKMQKKSTSDISNIQDVVALRVIVPRTEDCYQVLGLLHRLATPVSQRFKDYISFPKPNGYQSLHTCLLGLPHAPSTLIIEVQIRSEEMHREAEYGIAAHWRYKHGSAQHHAVENFHLSDIFLHQEVVEDGAGLSHQRSARFVDHMYVLTPRGDIRELPEGSTPLDFAFLIHTDLGLRFKLARVNGSIVPISYKLENGDIVEVLTHSHPHPSWQWLSLLATSSARSKLKNYFFSSHRTEFLSRGKQLLNAELLSRTLPLLDADLQILTSFDGTMQTLHEREDILVKIGMGSVKASSILRHLGLASVRPRPSRKKRLRAPFKPEKLLHFDDAPGDMPFRFARCCSVDMVSPRPSAIIGFITRSGDISIHRENCGMIKGANHDRRVSVQWA